MPQMAIDFNSPQVYCEPCFRDVPLLLSNPILKEIIPNHLFQEDF